MTAILDFCLVKTKTWENFPIAQKAITVTEPTSTTVWTKNQKESIEWTTTGTIKRVKIELYRGSSKEKNIVTDTKNDGEYKWTVSKSLEEGKNYKVRVSWTKDSSIYGDSEKFEISGYGKIKITSTPKGAKVYLDGQDTGETTNCTLTEVTPGNHTMKLTKAGYADWQKTVNVKAGKTTEIHANLTKLTIVVTKPAAGAIWGKGEDVQIKWQTTSSPRKSSEKTKDSASSNVKIVLYRGTILAYTIASSTPDDGSHTWTVANLQDALNYKVKISLVDTPSVTGESGEFILTKTKYEYGHSWKTWSGGAESFLNPYGVATDNSGYIYVADCGHHRIVKFNQSGSELGKFGSWDTANGHFKRPAGVAVDANGEIIVGDRDNHRIQKFESNFSWKWTKGGPTPGTGNYGFNEPRGVAVDAAGYIYVADTLNNRIQKYEPGSGWYRDTFDPTGAHAFANPTGVAVDSDGNIYVADKDNYRIQKFDSNGDFLLEWGSQGEDDGEFKSPWDIAIDKYGFVYVVDWINDCVQKFTPNGKFVCRFGGHGTGYGELEGPVGVAADKYGNVWVAEYTNNRLTKFK